MARKKKEQKKPSRERVEEYMGWKKEDICFALLSGENKASRCEVIEFHPDDLVTPCVSLREVETGKYRVAPFQSIADTAKKAKSNGEAWRKSQIEKKEGN